MENCEIFFATFLKWDKERDFLPFSGKKRKKPKRGREEEYNIYFKKEKPATGYLT